MVRQNTTNKTNLSEKILRKNTSVRRNFTVGKNIYKWRKS